MQSRLSLFALWGLLAACHDSSGSSSFLPPGTTDLGFASDDMALDGAILAASESEAGRDLNGDGDGDDLVLHVLDLDSGHETLVPNIADFTNGGGFVACRVIESREGRDLNGDGDEDDLVVHVVDGRHGTTVNLGLATEDFVQLAQSGPWIAFGVPELAQGGVDLDGDGEARSTIVHVHDAARGITTALPIPLSAGSHSIEVRGSWLVAVASEGSLDLNGDGDALGDDVIFTHDLVTGTTTNLGLAMTRIFGFDGRLLAAQIDEEEQSQDLNGDGDQIDHLLELVALESGTRHRFDQNAVFVRIGGGLAFLQLDEGGGKLLYDEQTDAFTDLGTLHMRGLPRLAERRMAFQVEEMDVGDQNGDGDESDGVLFLLDARTGTLTNTGLAILGEFDTSSDSFELDGRRTAFLYSAALDTGTAGWPDSEARLRDLDTGQVRSLLPSDDLALLDGLVLLLVPERRLGRDLNGNGDQNDVVLQVHDPVTDRTFNSGLAVPDFLFAQLQFDGPRSFAQSGRRLVVSVPESTLLHDGNGDGDFADSIVHVVRVP